MFFYLSMRKFGLTQFQNKKDFSDLKAQCYTNVEKIFLKKVEIDTII